VPGLPPNATSSNQANWPPSPAGRMISVSQQGTTSPPHTATRTLTRDHGPTPARHYNPLDKPTANSGVVPDGERRYGQG